MVSAAFASIYDSICGVRVRNFLKRQRSLVNRRALFRFKDELRWVCCRVFNLGSYFQWLRRRKIAPLLALLCSPRASFLYLFPRREFWWMPDFLFSKRQVP